MAGTAAWIDVLPNLSAFGTKLNSGVTAAATSAGRNAGKKFSDAMNQAAGRDVLSEQVKSLQQAEKRATSRKAPTCAYRPPKSNCRKPSSKADNPPHRPSTPKHDSTMQGARRGRRPKPSHRPRNNSKPPAKA